MPDHPSVADVALVASMGDVVLRNLRITQGYHELSAELARRYGTRANWCTFATWASKQAGQTIRKEDLAHALEAVLDVGPLTVAGDGVASATAALDARVGAAGVRALLRDALDLTTAVDRASDAVGRGNKKVFEEIGREFARFCATCLGDTRPDPGNIERFVADLRPGEPPEGQGLLRRAFGHYYLALFEPDAKSVLELLLLANLEVGWHEQTRLQPEIAESLDAALLDPAAFRRRVLAATFPFAGRLIRLRLAVTRLLGRPSPLDVAIDAFADAARMEGHRIITEHMMTLNLPGDIRLRLGDDVPAAIPPALRYIADPDLLALLAEIDPTPDSVAHSGALDWSDLPDRMHYITDLFRCYAADATLFEPPYTPEQTASIRAGRVPGGLP